MSSVTRSGRATIAGPVVRGTVIDLGAMRISSVRSNVTKVERTPRLARDDLIPSLLLGLQVRGSSLVAQDGRETVVRPAVRLSPGHPITEVATAYFLRLAGQAKSFADAGADAVSQPSLELLRAVISTHLDSASTQAKESRHATLQMRILEYVQAHLGDATLNAAQIAAAHHISVRHLYNVVAAGDISLGDWIRTRRLEACRDALGSSLSRNLSIAALSQRWGFRDASNFGRLFRNQYGRSPREWREAAARAQPAERATPHAR